MTATHTFPHHQRIDRLALVIGPLAVMAFFVFFASWTGPGQPSASAQAFWVVLTSGPWAVMWVGAAIGLGWPLRSLLTTEARDPRMIQIGLGVGVMLVLDEALGELGLLQRGGAVGALTLIGAGLVLLAAQIGRSIRSKRIQHFIAPPWLIWTAAPSIAVLLLAACSAPGWLWSSEFGGYDALSYHLQLPKEWLALGRIQPLQHNVYSFLPGYMEAGYYHLDVLLGDGIRAVYACQMLHACLTLLTGFSIYRLGARFIGPIAGAVAGVVFLGTPWVIVVGSLGYNEMAVELMLATGLLIIAQEGIESWRPGAALGVVAAAACGAKLTAMGMVALPLGVLLLMSIAPRRWPAALIAGAVAGVLCLLPYLLRNQLYAGNPVFPFATQVFGLGHWANDQPQIWMRGHLSDALPGRRFAELWNQFLRYGIGGNPYTAEPWKPQWSILPWLGTLGILIGLTFTRTRRWSARLGIVFIIQVAFWLFLTHIKSRFMLPAAVPLALGAAIGINVISERIIRLGRATKWRSALLALALLIWATVPVLIYRGEQQGAPAGGVDLGNYLSGDDLAADVRQQLGATAVPAIAVNDLLPADAKVLLLGNATPLYFRDKIAYQTTWDRGPLSKLMRQFPDDPAQWDRGLREQGFTHLLIDEGMLERWQKARWNDPLLTRERVVDFANRFGTAQLRYPNGVTLYRLGS